MQIYVEKLRESISEMSRIKESAIREENYALADQTKMKVTALHMQLIKMEHQLNADILTNCITQWQNELASEITSQLKTGKFRQVGSFPTSYTSHPSYVPH